MEEMKKEMVEKNEQVIELGEAKELTLGNGGIMFEQKFIQNFHIF